MRYFQGRVSSIEYKAEASGSNNYAPSNPDLAKRVEKYCGLEGKNPAVPVTEVPIDLVTNSGSGLDPILVKGGLGAGESHLKINEYSERKT